MATAFAVLIPFFFLGEPSGHDFEFHLNSWMEVLTQWKQGIVYPRWAALAHYGYGEARFLFYPPASWILGAALGAVLPWMIAPAAYIWLTLTAAGCSMFMLARRWLDGKDAIFAAALYAANPYHLVIVYWRSAFAELLAGVLLPLLLLFVLRAEEQGRRVILPLSLIVATAWLTNAPAALMLNYSLALLALVVAIQRRSARVLLWAGIAAVLGAGLVAFYVLPAAYEEKWVDISQVLAFGVRPQENFLFTLIDDPEHNIFNLLLSTVAAAQMIVLAAATLLSSPWRRRAPLLWWTVMLWSAGAALLMFPITRPAWDYLPELRFVQLPWRWLLCFNVAFALMVTMACRRGISRLLLCLGMLAVLVFGWQRLQPPWWDTAADIAEMQNNVREGNGYEGTDEYVPLGADPYEIQRDAALVSFQGKGQAQIRVQQWSPESRRFTADAPAAGNLALRLFNFPAWMVEVNGHPVETESREVTGQMMIPVHAGENRVQIAFVRTPDRTAGAIISLLALALMLGWVLVERRL
jgi:hypothetical protein